MGFIGGRLAYLFLKHQYPGGRNVPMARSHPYDGPEDSKLKVLLGPGIFDELRGKVVLDFGCGTGENAVELARNGCARVIGLDIRENVLRDARLRTESIGVADRCCFVTSWFEPVDVILSMDAFEHFEKPDEVLRMMLGLLKEDGYVLVAFGCPWYHPYGGHCFQSSRGRI